MPAHKERKLEILLLLFLGRQGCPLILQMLSVEPRFHQRFSPRTEEMEKVLQFLHFYQGSPEMKKQAAAVPLAHSRLA